MRSEIQGLRAMAVSFVVLFHLWPALLGGGFVGVDVFFVVSGYLITRRLVAQSEGGRLSVAEFWAKRARRLLPAALVVLSAAALGTFAWMPPGFWRQSFEEILASALYLQNWKLASDVTDYFAAVNQPSAVQHFWSLAVEEQFYFALPLLLLLAQKLAPPGPGQGRRRTHVTWLAIVTFASFVYCCVASTKDPSAYFSTPARAWEFGAGALLSFNLGPALPPQTAAGRAALRARPVLAWCGVVLCLAAALGFDSQTVFPGPATIVPVLGTALVIWAADGGTVFEPAALSRFRPVLLLGELSYAIYLWHWPLIVWTPLVTGQPLAGTHKLILLFASLGLAWFTTRYIERPIRFPRAGQESRPRIVCAWSLAGMGAVASIVSAGLMRTTAAEAASLGALSDLEARQPGCFGASATRARSGQCPARESDWTRPHPAFPRRDVVQRSDCRAPDGGLRVCTLGPETGYAKRLAALGDSHTAALLPAYEAIAKAMNWRIDVASKNACYWTSALQSYPSASRVEECQRWKAELSRRLAESEPYEAILVTHRVDAFQPEGSSPEAVQTAIVQGMIDVWRAQTARGTKIIALRDNPKGTADTADCIARHLLQANDVCSLDRRVALAVFDGHISATQALSGTYLIDLSDTYCDARRCPAVIGNVVVYRDANHITATFARSLAPILLSELRKILG